MQQEAYQVIYKVEKKHWWFRVRTKLLVMLVKKFFPFKQGDLKILDIGCGTGLNSRTLEKFGTVTSLDNSPHAISFCKEKGLTDLRLGDANHLPFADATFDLVIALDVLEHLKDDQGAVVEIQRVLKKGGVFIAFVPAFSFLWSKHDEYLLHQRRYNQKMLRGLFEGGWNELKVSYFNIILFPLVALMRLAIRYLGLPDKDSFERMPAFNAPFYYIFNTEVFLLPYINLPFGVSLMGVYQKK